MPEIIPMGAPYPRAVLGWDGTAYRVFTVDAAGHLQIDVLGTVLPPGAATAANQATMITALQLIDNLYNALHSVNTDELVVRGEDQLFSYLDPLRTYTGGNISGDDGYVGSPACPPGEIWAVTNVVAYDVTTATTRHDAMIFDGAGNYRFHSQAQAFAAEDRSEWQGHVYLETTDVVRVSFLGGLVGDAVRLFVLGYRMTVEP